MINKYIAFNATLALLLLHALNSSLRAQENCAELIERIRPAVVALVSYNDEGEVIQCGNGFFISSDGRLLSSRHLLRNASAAEVHTRSGEVYPIKMVLSEDSNQDLIELLIDLTAREVPYLKMTDVRMTSGDQVTVIGHQHIIQGFVSHVRSHSESSGNFLVASGATARAPGGPVINKKGEVIAIATEQTVADQPLILGIASSRVRAMKAVTPLTIDDWNKTTKGEPTDAADGLFFAGANMILNNDYLRAFPLFERAVQGNPGDAEAHFYCGYTKAKLQHYDEALHDYREATRIAPDWVEAFNNLGATYQALGRLRDAVEVYNQAIKLKPDFSIGYINLGGALGRLARYEEAIAVYRHAIQLTPNSASTYNCLGVAYHKIGELQNALESFNRAVQLNADFAEALNNFGVVYSYLGRDQEAIETLKRAIGINPKFPDAYNNLGLVYAKIRHHSEGIESYKEAVSLNPNFAEAHYNVGVSYLALGDDQSAFDTYGKLKNLDQKLANRLFGLLERQYTVGATTIMASAINGYATLDAPPSQTAIQGLVNMVKDLIAKGALHREIADGLIAELQITGNQPDTPNGIIKINLLGRFVERVSDMVRVQEISEEDGQPLIDVANGIINQLSD